MFEDEKFISFLHALAGAASNYLILLQFELASHRKQQKQQNIWNKNNFPDRVKEVCVPFNEISIFHRLNVFFLVFITSFWGLLLRNLTSYTSIAKTEKRQNGNKSSLKNSECTSRTPRGSTFVRSSMAAFQRRRRPEARVKTIWPVGCW